MHPVLNTWLYHPPNYFSFCLGGKRRKPTRGRKKIGKREREREGGAGGCWPAKHFKPKDVRAQKVGPSKNWTIYPAIRLTLHLHPSRGLYPEISTLHPLLIWTSEWIYSLFYVSPVSPWIMLMSTGSKRDYFISFHKECQHLSST